MCVWCVCVDAWVCRSVSECMCVGVWVCVFISYVKISLCIPYWPWTRTSCLSLPSVENSSTTPGMVYQSCSQVCLCHMIPKPLHTIVYLNLGSRTDDLLSGEYHHDTFFHYDLGLGSAIWQTGPADLGPSWGTHMASGEMLNSQWLNLSVSHSTWVLSVPPESDHCEDWIYYGVRTMLGTASASGLFLSLL